MGLSKLATLICSSFKIKQYFGQFTIAIIFYTQLKHTIFLIYKTYSHTHTYTYVYRHIHTHTHIHTYTHVYI